MSTEQYMPTTDEVAEVWAMSEPNPDGYTSIGLAVPNEAEQRAEFTRWLDRIRAEAWDEGRKAGVDDMIAAELGTFRSRKPNPYLTTKEN